MDKQVLSALDALLDDERAALIAGDLDRIAVLADRKASLVAGLADTQDDKEALLPLHHKIKRNQALLDGALEGIRTVTARIAAMRGVNATLETYDRNGRRQTWYAPRGNGVERRA